jgi:HAE1 family hydrophobic/amphiphilic exporter-1
MTSMTMVFGLLPLALATGVGANGNRSLGVGAIGGMVIGTIALLFIVPVLFIIFQSIEERVIPHKQ